VDDSFLDRLGELDDANVVRWNAQQAADVSYIPSMVDALMNYDQPPTNPTQDYMNLQRRALDLFVQVDAPKQLTCEYFGNTEPPGAGGCGIPNRLHTATSQTAEFLLDQKVIGRLHCSEGLLCQEDFLDGSYLQDAYRPCSSCYPVGPYLGSLAGTNTLLDELERLDSETGKSSFAQSESGRKGGDSACQGHAVLNGGSITSTIGDGAGAEDGKSYSGTYTRILCLFCFSIIK
jgi:hypothetical protein